MRRTVRRIAGLLAGIALGFAMLTLLALEGNEVVVLRTGAGQVGRRETRTWIADHDGAVWIEAANPEREFYRQILQNPRVELRRRGALRPYRATAIITPAGHALIRRLLAAKYGWADRWIGLLTDTSQSIAIRLEPE